MLKFENNRISGPESFEHKETLKFHGCMWDKENKNWWVKEDADIQILKDVVKAVNEMEKKKTMEKWKQACEECEVAFAKKGTPEYAKVLLVFKNL